MLTFERFAMEDIRVGYSIDLNLSQLSSCGAGDTSQSFRTAGHRSPLPSQWISFISVAQRY